MEDYWKKHPDLESITTHQKSNQENLLISLRVCFLSSRCPYTYKNRQGKLREGIISSKRDDFFASEVYKTSLLHSIIFQAPDAHIAAIASYPIIFSSQDHDIRSVIGLHKVMLTNGKCACEDVDDWIAAIGRYMRVNNYFRVDELLSRHCPNGILFSDTLMEKAIWSIASRMRTRIRNRTINVLCVAYRQGPDSWLRQVLMLSEKDSSWLASAEKDSRIKRKDGFDHTWLFIRQK